MNDLQQYHHFKTRIAELTKQVEIQRDQKRQAILARNAIKSKNYSKTVVLLNLVLDGRCDLSNKEIAEMCFVTQKNVIDQKSRIRKSRNAKQAHG